MDDADENGRINLAVIWPFIIAALALAVLLACCGCSGEAAARTINPESVKSEPTRILQ